MIDETDRQARVFVAYLRSSYRLFNLMNSYECIILVRHSSYRCVEYVVAILHLNLSFTSRRSL